MSAIADALNPGGMRDADAVWAEIPAGFVALPLADSAERLVAASKVVAEVAPTELRTRVSNLAAALGYLMAELAGRQVRYCGLGHHLSSLDGTPITSCLTLSVHRLPVQRNPRLALSDLLRAKADAGERGQADLLDLAGRPTLFFERTRELPDPHPQDGAEDGAVTVFQLQAMTPSTDGGQLAVIDFATPFASYGPEFRRMVVLMAASLSFDPPVGAGREGVLSMDQVLNGEL